MNKGAKYILWRFTQLNRARLSIYPHLTQATDTSNVSCPLLDVASRLLLGLTAHLFPSRHRFGSCSPPSKRRSYKTPCATLASCRRASSLVSGPSIPPSSRSSSTTSTLYPTPPLFHHHQHTSCAPTHTYYTATTLARLHYRLSHTRCPSSSFSFPFSFPCTPWCT